jgi:hypothetical protein
LKTKDCTKNSTTPYENWPNYDAQWKASMPYPTNPFTIVNPKELAKRRKLREKNQLDSIEEALL